MWFSKPITLFNLGCVHVNLFFKGRRARHFFSMSMALSKNCTLFCAHHLLLNLQLVRESLQQWDDLLSHKLKIKNSLIIFQCFFLNTNQGEQSPDKLSGKIFHIDGVSPMSTVPFEESQRASTSIILIQERNEASDIFVVAIGCHELWETTCCDPEVDLQIEQWPEKPCNFQPFVGRNEPFWQFPHHIYPHGTNKGIKNNCEPPFKVKSVVLDLKTWGAVHVNLPDSWISYYLSTGSRSPHLQAILDSEVCPARMCLDSGSWI